MRPSERSQVGSRQVKFGTSGLLYRSNKLLFDELAVRGHRFVKITTEADNKGAIRYCYESQLTRFPTLRGKVVVDFIIETNGSVKTIKLPSNSISNKSLHSNNSNKLLHSNNSSNSSNSSKLLHSNNFSNCNRIF